jgi:hypothetical protein
MQGDSKKCLHMPLRMADGYYVTELPIAASAGNSQYLMLLACSLPVPQVTHP